MMAVAWQCSWCWQPHLGLPSAPDCLQVRRLMEEDNRKARKAARKAYNEAGKCCTECAV